MDGPSRADVDDIIKRKRKVREHKACYPCRQRKVRCDSNVPCKTCVERQHADICTWNPPAKRLDNGSTHASLNGISQGASVTIASEEWDRICTKLNTIERTLVDLKSDLRRVSEGSEEPSGEIGSSPPPNILVVKDEPDGPDYVRAMEISEQNQLTGESVHLGGGSVPALIKALRAAGNTPAVQEVFGSNVLPLFGLDNENATYPFISLWDNPKGAAGRIQELQKALPSDADCIGTFRQYKDGAYVTFPGIVEIEKFEQDLLLFLANRSSRRYEGDESPSTMYGINMQWVALLFAMLSSGSQFSPSMPKSQRELISGVYACCSFECLRLVNYLANASLDTVQAMLVLGNVLANGMNAGAAWAFLGMTMRLAQSLGLHRSELPSSPDPACIARSKLWWAILWMDSFLSISYDRASSAATVDCPFPPVTQPDLGYSYHEAIYRVCKIGLDTIRNRVANQTIHSRLGRCSTMRDEVQRTQDGSRTHLKDLANCRSIIEQSEYWMLNLHASFMKSELCRPAISPSTAEFDTGNELRKQCIENLTHTVEAFLGLSNVSPTHTRSWAITHRALSSALLLGILGEPLRNDNVQELLGRLIDVMKNSSVAHDPAALSAPIQRSVSALRKLCALETRTPRHVDDYINGGRSSTDPSYSYEGTNGSNGVNHGMWDFDSSTFYLPSPLSGFEDDSSPHALMDSIIFGGSHPTSR